MCEYAKIIWKVSVLFMDFFLGSQYSHIFSPIANQCSNLSSCRSIYISLSTKSIYLLLAKIFNNIFPLKMVTKKNGPQEHTCRESIGHFGQYFYQQRDKDGYNASVRVGLPAILVAELTCYSKCVYRHLYCDILCCHE